VATTRALLLVGPEIPEDLFTLSSDVTGRSAERLQLHYKTEVFSQISMRFSVDSILRLKRLFFSRYLPVMKPCRRSSVLLLCGHVPLGQV